MALSSVLVRPHPDLLGVGVGVTGLGTGVTVAATLVAAVPEVGSGVAVGTCGGAGQGCGHGHWSGTRPREMSAWALPCPVSSWRKETKKAS